jgi:hypothetical protein
MCNLRKYFFHPPHSQLNRSHYLRMAANTKSLLPFSENILWRKKKELENIPKMDDWVISYFNALCNSYWRFEIGPFPSDVAMRPIEFKNWSTTKGVLAYIRGLNWQRFARGRLGHRSSGREIIPYSAVSPTVFWEIVIKSLFWNSCKEIAYSRMFGRVVDGELWE